MSRDRSVRVPLGVLVLDVVLVAGLIACIAIAALVARGAEKL